MAAAAGAPAKEESSGDDPGGLKALDALVDQIHGAAKWFLGAFAGVGALVIPGLQLTQLGALDGLRLVLALLAVLVGVVAAIVAAMAVASLLGAERPTLAHLEARERRGSPDDPLVAYFRENPSIFLGEAETPAALLDELKEAREKLRRERETEHGLGQPSNDSEKEALRKQAKRRRSAESDLRVLRQITASVEHVARFQNQRSAFVERRDRIVACTVVVALAMAGFAVAANPAKEDAADFGGATVRGVDFGGSRLSGADFDGATIDRVSFKGSELDAGALDGAEMKNVTCPDGTPARKGCDGGS